MCVWCPRCLALPLLTGAIRAKTGWLQSSCPSKLYVCPMSSLSVRTIIALDRNGEKWNPVDLAAREGPGISARASSACPRHGGAREREGRIGEGRDQSHYLQLLLQGTGRGNTTETYKIMEVDGENG